MSCYNSHYEKFTDGKVVCINEKIPFEIPSTWEWCRIIHIATSQLGKTLDKGRQEGKEYPYLCSINVYWDCINLSNVKTFMLKDDELERYKLHKEDLLICEGGDYGRCNIWESDDDMYYQNALHRVRFYGNLSVWFYKWVFELYRNIGYIVGQGQTIKHFTFENMKSLLFPVPPLVEQFRIIDKIKDILPVVEKYSVIQERQRLLNINIKSMLQKSVLQEAIQGKLVPQDPNDEPASILLQRIKDEKLRLVKEGKLKKKDVIDSTIFRGDDNRYYEKIGKEITDITNEIPFDIPNSWAWCRLSNVVNIIMGQSPDGSEVYENDEKDNAYEFHQGKICFTDKYIAPSGKWCKEPSRIADIGSLLVCVRAPIGDVNITQRQIGIGRGLAAITGYKEITSDFLFYWLLAHKKILVDKGTGSTFKAITAEVLKNLIIPVPPFAEQQRIVTQINTLFDRTKD